MEYIRVFQSQEDATEQLAQITHPTLSAVRGGGFIGLHQGVTPTPPTPVVDPTTPFYIEDVSGSDNTIQIIINKQTSAASQIQNTIYKSTDGETWELAGTTSYNTILDIVVPANSRLYLRCKPKNLQWGDGGNYNYFYEATGNYAVGGNINSLLYGDTFNGQIDFPNNTGTNVFFRLFSKGASGTNTKLVNAGNLLLPSTTLTYECYRQMFNKCTSLVTAPALPATTLAQSCYFQMFYGCTSLTTAPALPATTLAQECYSNMFYGCTSLTTAPALPATTLAQSCYNAMFSGCTSLTVAPELPATTLATYCYVSMFKGCTNLNYIKCLATNISATSCTNMWVTNVAATGTFVKDPNMSDWTEGEAGIPSGWTVRNPNGIELSQSLNVATIKMVDLDSGTGYYTINGGSHISLSEGTTNIPITQAMNGQTLLVYGEFDGESMQETLTLSWTDYSPAVTITETDNYVTIASATADTIQYRLGSSGEYTTYTAPVYIASNTTIYVIATKTVSGVVYTTNESQAVTHTVTPPTNLTISCLNNTVTITANNAQTIEYNFDGSSTYTTYTEPFAITETVTVYAKATNVDGSITTSQECVYSEYIDELISMGCKFWAPLTENDITEQISETSPTQGGGQLTWDSTKSAYKFKTTSGNQEVLVYNIPGVNNVTSYTIIADVWWVSGSTAEYFSVGSNSNSVYDVCQTHRFQGNTQGSWKRLVQTFDSNTNTIIWYMDGVSVRTAASGYNGARPNNWTYTGSKNYTTLGYVHSSQTFEAYIKNVYMFDHELTASEINSLQYN